MNDCGQIRPGLGGYVLDGLTPEERDAVEEHLTGCARCREQVAELSPLPELLAAAWSAPPPAPDDLRRRVLARFEGARRGRRVPVWLAAASMVLAAVIGGGIVAVADRPPPPDVVLALHPEAPVGIVGEAALTQVPAGVEVRLDLVGVRDAEYGYYHAWLHRGERRVSAGTFVGTAEGEVAVQLLCGGALDAYERLTVTWQPAGTGDEVLAIDAELG